MRDVRILLVGALALASLVSAKEGMWTPDQLPQIAEDLRDTGLELDPATLTDLTAFPTLSRQTGRYQFIFSAIIRVLHRVHGPVL